MKFSIPGSSAGRAARRESAGCVSRHSTGFEQFCSFLKTPEGLSILDMSGVSQANITFITGLGHRISSEDIVENVLQAAGNGGGEQDRAAKDAQLLEQTLTFPAASFDGALVWDALQFLAPPLVNRVAEKLLGVMRPGGIILAFFTANDKVKEIPVYRYRIQDAKTLQQLPRGGGTLAVQNFNNRSIEKLFEAASSVKFFLTRDNLREVLIRR